MSLFLPKLTCKKDIDEVIKGVAEKVVVLRFGRDEDSVCLQLDEIVRSLVSITELLFNIQRCVLRTNLSLLSILAIKNCP